IVSAATTLVSVEFETLAKLDPTACMFDSVEIIEEDYKEYEYLRSLDKSSDVVLVQYDSFRGRFYYFLTNDKAAAELSN
ncbi:hypothetical protein AAVH_37862, partial [Aphelenchoides avenae]